MTKSEQARADAMADAETLRLFVGVFPTKRARGICGACRGSGIKRSTKRYNDKHDIPLSQRVYGEHLVCQSCGGSGSKELDAESVVLAARAAFRAVPGLR